MKVELAIMKGAPERFVELSTKDVTEHLDGKKEIVAWFDPARVIGRQSAGWHHAMDMWVGRELLTPSVQNAEEADFCTEVFGIAGHFEKSFRTGAKQEIVEDLLVLQDQWGQMTRKREDHMDVARWEKLLATCCEPAIRELLPDTSGSADFYRSCRRWRDVRSECTHRDVRRARRCDTAEAEIDVAIKSV